MNTSLKFHPASSYPLEYHFQGKKNDMRYLFDELIKQLSKTLDFKLKIGKTSISLAHTLVFAAIRVQTKKLILEFATRKELTHPRIIKSFKFQKARWAHSVELKQLSDIDQELIEWVRVSYE